MMAEQEVVSGVFVQFAWTWKFPSFLSLVGMTVIIVAGVWAAVRRTHPSLMAQHAE